MIRSGMLKSLTVVLVLVALAASTGSAQPDSRGAEIKKRLERLGLKVTDVSFAPAKGPSPAVWAAGTVGTYAQPSWDRVLDQSLTVWNVMFTVLKGEPAKTVLSSPQDWKTFRLFVGTTLEKITAFDAGVRSAKTDADRQQLFQALYAGIIFRVFDMQQQKLIDDKEFVKNNFVK